MSRLTLPLALLLAACGNSGHATPPTPDPVPSTDNTPTGPAGPSVTRDQFELVAATDGPLTAGQLGQVKITLRGRNGWHVNQDFPVSVDLTAPATVALAKARLERADATAFDETHFEFSAPVTPSAAGTAALRATVSFAVCTDANCAPYTENLALDAPVM
jgi:hypothetical protein